MELIHEAGTALMNEQSKSFPVTLHSVLMLSILEGIGLPDEKRLSTPNQTLSRETGTQPDANVPVTVICNHPERVASRSLTDGTTGSSQLMK